MAAATRHQLSPDLEIRLVTAPSFLATKIEAFKGRGRGDFYASHDLEDLVFVIDGRSTIVEEVQTEAPLLREYLRTEIRGLLTTPGFIDALPGYLLPDAASQARLGTVLRRLEAIKRPPSPGDTHDVGRRAQTSSQHSNRRAACVCGRWPEQCPGLAPEFSISGSFIVCLITAVFATEAETMDAQRIPCNNRPSS